jgi:hypothetical protein
MAGLGLRKKAASIRDLEKIDAPVRERMPRHVSSAQALEK